MVRRGWAQFETGAKTLCLVLVFGFVRTGRDGLLVNGMAEGLSLRGETEAGLLQSPPLAMRGHTGSGNPVTGRDLYTGESLISD